MRPEDIAEASPPEVPGYRAISAVGAGSHGVVFRARELATQDIVALKVLRPEYARALAAPPVARARRCLEDRIARLADARSQALVVPREVVEFSDEEGGRQLALVIPYIEGDSLTRALQRNVRFAPARASGLASDVARALGAAHEAGLFHGALHPGKILLAETGECPGGGGGARVLGAGLGETLSPDFDDPRAVVRLSPHVYAASEVLAGDPPGEAADVFSLGAVLYHVLTGLAPYRARSLAALKVERADGPPVWPRGATEELPAPLVRLVDRMMDPRAAARPRLDSRILSELAGAARGRRPSAFRRTSGRPTPGRAPETLAQVRLEPPVDVAPLEEAPARPAVPSAKAGALGRALSAARGLLRRPSATPAMVGGSVVVFLLALSVLLEPSEQKPTPAAVERAEGVAISRTAPGAAGRPTARPAATAGPRMERRPPVEGEPADAALDDLRAIERIFAENPADAEAFRSSLDGFSRREGDTGARAGRLLSRLNEHRRKRADHEIARLLDRAGALEAAGRYGEALAAVGRFPHDRYPLADASERARREAGAIRGRAARAFAETERRAGECLARNDFDGARAEYEALRATIGMAGWLERAAEAVARIGRLEEEAAAAAGRRRAAAEDKAYREDVARAFAGIARSCRAFRYTDAVRKLEAVAAKLGTALDAAPSRERAVRIEEDRGRLALYGELVRREAAQFRLVAERIRTGKREGDLGWRNSGSKFAIRDVTEDGIRLSRDTGTMEFSWSRVPDDEAYNLMLIVGSDVTKIDERLALAVFAHHRGLDVQRENELRVAEGLARSAGAKARSEVRRVREALSEIEVGVEGNRR